MARKLLDLEEAAKMLGVTPDTLNEIRERREIYGYRDGGSWKFKSEDVEKLVADRTAAAEEGEFAEVDEDPDSILLSEVELGQSDESTSSTIIGGRSTPKDSLESDIQIAQPKHDSDVNLDAAVGSDIKGGSDVLEMGSGVSPMFDDLDSLDLDMPSASDSGVISGASSGSSLELGKEGGTSAVTLGSDALKLEPGSNLAFSGEDQLALGEASGLETPGSKAGGSAIDLVGDEDGDLVLGGSSHGGDLSRAGDSGIGLMNPADSGLSLESAPLQLGGSAVESLDLGEDDMLDVDQPAAKSAAKTVAGAQPQSDDDFLLTPLEEAGAEESDSGSQVIALEGDVEFGEADASGGVGTLEAAEGMGLLEEDLGEGLGAAALGAAALTPTAAQMAAAAPGGAMQAPEAPFSGWNVASLAMCSILLLLSGMLSYDLMRNMWSWNGPYSVNSSIMDLVLSWFQK
ncbi:MAG TPA: helix-turn-helix domain-containing protein [Pirellulales bacterium]|nr:helix-turn-helix domain-containing protein [Pirellulales bacterium]